MNASFKHFIVVGGGAAGIFCAVNAARGCSNLRVTVLEKSGKLLGKVKVSGGGRCNVTHDGEGIGEMSDQYPRGARFVKRALYHFGVQGTVHWFAERGVALKTEADGRMFPVTDSSQTIIDCLMREVERYGVDILSHAEVKDVTVHGQETATESRFQVTLADGRELKADFVCVACGGYSKSDMFDWIRRMGHTIEEPVPSLFTFNMPGEPITRLMGITVPEVQVKIVGNSLVETGPLLITHWGLSGPVVLRLSAWGARELSAAGYRFGIRVNWLPGQTEQEVRSRLQQLRYDWASRLLWSGNAFGFPQRLWEYWLTESGIAERMRWADLPSREQNKLAGLLSSGEFSIAGKTTFKEEFVTAGGVRLTEVEPATCQSRKVAGLFFAGEVLDVDGVTGGYNFQHAWTSGWIVAEAVVAAVENSGK